MSETYNFVTTLVKETGREILKKYHHDIVISFKHGDPQDIVTNVDTEINTLISKKIQEKYPLHAIYSEESEIISSQKDTFTWTIDPIDGTHNFSRGFYHFATCVALLKNNMPILGAVYNPVTDELFSFEKGSGAYLNGERIYTSKKTELSKAFVLLRAGRKEGNAAWGATLYQTLLEHKAKVSNLGSSSLDICFVAAGRAEATIYGTLSTMDVACAIGILEEAGGTIVQLENIAEKISTLPQKILAVANNSMCKKILPLTTQ